MSLLTNRYVRFILASSISIYILLNSNLFSKSTVQHLKLAAPKFKTASSPVRDEKKYYDGEMVYSDSFLKAPPRPEIRKLSANFEETNLKTNDARTAGRKQISNERELLNTENKRHKTDLVHFIDLNPKKPPPGKLRGPVGAELSGLVNQLNKVQNKPSKSRSEQLAQRHQILASQKSKMTPQSSYPSNARNEAPDNIRFKTTLFSGDTDTNSSLDLLPNEQTNQTESANNIIQSVQPSIPIAYYKGARFLFSTAISGHLSQVSAVTIYTSACS